MLSHTIHGFSHKELILPEEKNQKHTASAAQNGPKSQQLHGETRPGWSLRALLRRCCASAPAASEAKAPEEGGYVQCVQLGATVAGRVYTVTYILYII